MMASLVALVLVLVAAVSTAIYVYQIGRQRRQVLSRVDGRTAAARLPVRLLVEDGDGAAERVGAWLRARLPAAWLDDQALADRLVQAGLESPGAGPLYASARVACGVLVPLVALALAPGGSTQTALLYAAAGVVAGVFAPVVALDYLVQRRRAVIRRALPDALDLLVVCVEAGVSLDAAILRVARDMAGTHPELAAEFLVVNRRVNAGVGRDQALHGLWARTGVEELRGLAANMTQSKKWGTSIGKVLRVYAEGLRRKRRQEAQQQAAAAGLKMLFPLMLFLLPALFVVILGPAALRMVGAAGIVQ